MKIHRLLLIIAVSFLGISNANALLTIGVATATSTINLTSASVATNAEPIMSFSIKTTTNNTDDYFYEFDFTSNFPPGTNFTNFQLLRNTTNSVTGATNLGATFNNIGTNNMTVNNFTNGNFGAAGTYDEIYKTTYYYFIVADYTATSAGSLQISFSKADFYDGINGNFTSTSQTTPVGPTFNFNPPATIKITSNTATTLNNPIYFSESTNVIFSFGVQTNTGTATFNTFTLLGTSGGTNSPFNTYFSNFKLYSSTGADYKTDLSSSTTPLTSVAFSTSGGATATPTITITGGKSINPSVLYYFIIADFTLDASVFSPPNAIINDYLLSLTNATGSIAYSTTSNFSFTDLSLSPNEYVWTGAANDSKWITPLNWSNYAITKDNFTPGATSTTYPGYAATNDMAIFIASTTATVNLATAINPILQLQTTNTYTINLNITNSAVTLTTSNLYLGGTYGSTGTTPLTGLGNYNVGNSGTFTLGGGGTLAISNMGYLYGTGYFNLPTGGNLSLISGSTLYLLGGATTRPTTILPAQLTLTGGTLSASGATIETYSAYALLTNNGGTCSLTNNSTLLIYEGTAVNTSGTFTVDNSIVNCNSGNFSYYDNGNSLVNNGGTFNIQNGSNLELTYNYSVLTNSSGYFNILSSSINFNNGYCTLYNSGSGTFTLDPTSSINFFSGTGGPNNVVNNTSTNPFTLLSTSAGSATIGPMNQSGASGDAMAGIFNVQRLVSGGNSAYRGYRLISSPVNKNYAYTAVTSTSGTGQTTLTVPAAAINGTNNVIDLTYLGANLTIPVASPAIPTTYNGAYIGGPVTNTGGFTNPINNPILYLYRESIAPGTQLNSSFTSGKYVGINAITSSTSPTFTVTTKSTALGYASIGADNASNVLIPAGNAELFYYIGSNTRNALYGTNALSATYPPNDSYVTASGYINQNQIPFYLWGTATGTGAVTKSLTFTNGTNSFEPGITVVGNPYPANLDLHQLYLDNAAAFGSSGEAFNQLDITSQQYVAYNGNGTSSSGNTYRYVESGQGFFVTVPSATYAGKTLYFNEIEKTNTSPSVQEEGIRIPTNPVLNNISSRNTTNSLRTPVSNKKPNKTLNANLRNTVTISDSAVITANTKPIEPPLTPVKNDTSTVVKLTGLHLKLVQDSLNYDECGIYFNSKWSDSFDSNDAMDLDGRSGKVSLSSYSSDKVRTSINAMSMFTAKGKRIPLYVSYSASGLYSLGLEDIANFNTNYGVFLIDNLLKDSLDLTLYKSYNFNYTAGTANDSTRFILAIEHKPIPHYALLSFSGAKSTDGVLLDWKTVNESNNVTFVLQKLGVNNTYACLDSLHSDSAGAYSYIDLHPSLGGNTYRLQQTDALGNITYSAPVTIGYNSIAPNGGLVIYPNPAKSIITITLNTSSTATEVATADIYNTSGKLIEHKVVSSNSFRNDVSAYQLGVYIIELKNSNGVLIGKSKFVKVN
jgi:hypothetical protein